MAKNSLCKDCRHNNNGWCEKRKTNKGLKELTECEFKKESNLYNLEIYLEQKQFELKRDNNAYNRGIIMGIKNSLAILNGEYGDEQWF